MEHSDPILEVLIMACRKPGMYGLDFRYESVVHFFNGAHAGGTAVQELTDYRNCRRRGGVGAVYARFLERFPLAYSDAGAEE